MTIFHRQSLHLFGLPGLANVGQVEEGIYRGADPSPNDGYYSLAQLGIKTVLNLSRGEDAKPFQLYGIREIYAPMAFFRDVNDMDIRNLTSLVSDTTIHPLFVHCAQGRDRTGMVIACHRIEQGWQTKDAIDEMWSFGFHYIWSHFLEFVRAYQPASK